MRNNEARDAHAPSARETLEYSLQSLMEITPLDIGTSLKTWEVKREQFIQQWAVESVQWRLCVIWRLRNTLFRAPLLSEEALCWGIRLVKDTLGELGSMGEGANLSTLDGKGLDIMEEIIRAALHSTPGAQLSREVILAACEVGEIMLFHIELKGRVAEIVRMFSELPDFEPSRGC